MLIQSFFSRTFIIPFLGLSLLCGAPCHAQGAAKAKTAQAQKSQAQKVLVQFLALNNQKKLQSAAAKTLLTGEATRLTQTATLGPTTAAPDAMQFINARHIVARVQSLHGKSPVTDLYFYLTLSGASSGAAPSTSAAPVSTWKISALRSLALASVFEERMQELQKKSVLTKPESQELANMKLTLSLDRELHAYFKGHRPLFDKLQSLAAKNTDNAQSLARQAGLNHVARDKNGTLQFVIGGMIDSTIGYLYIPSNQPPKIDPDDYIWIEKITDKWYLFRTT